MKGLISFLKYNNAIPLIAIVVTVGASSTYAYNNPEVLIDEEQQVISIDNTYLAGKNLKKYTPKAKILEVTEDDEKYYVAYTFTTISLKDYVWQDVTTDGVIEVFKDDLTPKRDLGLYVTEQLKQIIKREAELLKKTQEIEKKQVSQKKIARKYSGLVGRFMDEETETLPGYKPVVKPKPKPETVWPEPKPKAKEVAVLKPVPENIAPDEEEVVVTEDQEEVEGVEEGEGTEEVSEEETTEGNEEAEEEVAEDEESTETGSGSGTDSETDEDEVDEPPELELLGKDVVTLNVGDSYTDLGVRATDDVDEDLTVVKSVNGVVVEAVILDTSTSSVYEIEYSVTDTASNTATMLRTVTVVEPVTEDPETDSDTEDETNDTEDPDETNPDSDTGDDGVTPDDQTANEPGADSQEESSEAGAGTDTGNQTETESETSDETGQTNDDPAPTEQNTEAEEISTDDSGGGADTEASETESESGTGAGGS